MVTFQLEEATIGSIHRAMRSRELTARHLVELYLHRIEAYDRGGLKLNAMAHLSDQALHDASSLDAHLHDKDRLVGPLHGIPIVLKDSINTADMATSYGSIAFRNYKPAADATLVTKLREAGAVILGKTQLPDFATSWFGHSSYGGETLNPYAIEHDPGGSSSGTGVAVAANLATAGIGGDCGGSIRVPAAFNNLVGVRPTTRLISAAGVAAMVEFEDTVGPMARTVRDAACLLDVLVGYDPADPYTACAGTGRPVAGYVSVLREEALEGARIGVVRDLFGPASEPECTQAGDVVDVAIRDMANAGADVVDPVVIPNRAELIARSTLYAQQCKHDFNQFFQSLVGSPIRSFAELYGSKQYLPSLDFMDVVASGPDQPEHGPGYFRGLHAREELQREILGAMAASGVDLLVYPTVQIAAPSKEAISTGRWGTLNFPTNTSIAAHATLPAISLPVGFTETGLPVGMEIVGRPYAEATILAVAYGYERAFRPRRAPNDAPPLVTGG